MPQPLPSTFRIDAFLEQPSSVRTPEIVEADPRNCHILAVAGKATRERIGATGSPVPFVRANPLASHPAPRLRQSAARAARCFPRASAALDGGEIVRRRLRLRRPSPTRRKQRSTLAFADLGNQSLKNIAAPARAHRVRMRDAGALMTLEISPARPHNSPHQATSGDKSENGIVYGVEETQGDRNLRRHGDQLLRLRRTVVVRSFIPNGPLQ